MVGGSPGRHSRQMVARRTRPTSASWQPTTAGSSTPTAKSHQTLETARALGGTTSKSARFASPATPLWIERSWKEFPEMQRRSWEALGISQRRPFESSEVPRNIQRCDLGREKFQGISSDATWIVRSSPESHGVRSGSWEALEISQRRPFGS